MKQTTKDKRFKNPNRRSGYNKGFKSGQRSGYNKGFTYATDQYIAKSAAKEDEFNKAIEQERQLYQQKLVEVRDELEGNIRNLQEDNNKAEEVIRDLRAECNQLNDLLAKSAVNGPQPQFADIIKKVDGFIQTKHVEVVLGKGLFGPHTVSDTFDTFDVRGWRRLKEQLQNNGGT